MSSRQTYLNTLHLISAFFSLFFNTILIYLVLRKSPKHIGVYKYLMVFISCFEIVYSAFDVFLRPFHYSYKTIGMVVVSVTDKPIGATGLVILDSIYWGFFGASLAIFAVHFIYRYLVVSENPLLETFSSKKIIFWMLLPIVSFLTWMLTGIFLCGPDEETTDTVKMDFESGLERKIEEFIYLGFYLYSFNEDGGIKIHWIPSSGVGISCMTMIFSLGVILHFGHKCYCRLQQKIALIGGVGTSSSSTRSTNLQAQLFFALIMQTSIPALLMHFPVAIIFMFIIAGKGIGIYTSVVSFTIALYPAMDPLPNFFLIAPYRNAIISFFKCQKSGQIQPMSTSQNTGIVTT